MTLLRLLVLVLAFGSSAAHAQSAKPARDVAGRFDYYLLALSWSPSYCADPDAAARDRLQCQSARPFAFVVHGLWPQNERGWPADCPTTQPRDVAPALVNAQLDLMPSPGLVQHQWDKHGTCTGLSQPAYFQATRTMRSRVAIPPAYVGLVKPVMATATEVEAAFLKANPTLKADQIVVTCDARRIREVRICFTKQGAFRACGADVRDRCGPERKLMPPVRGAAPAPVKK